MTLHAVACFLWFAVVCLLAPKSVKKSQKTGRPKSRMSRHHAHMGGIKLKHSFALIMNLFLLFFPVPRHMRVTGLVSSRYSICSTISAGFPVTISNDVVCVES